MTLYTEDYNDMLAERDWFCIRSIDAETACDEAVGALESLQDDIAWNADQIAELCAEIAELRTERSPREVELAAEVGALKDRAAALKARVETERAEAHEAAEYAARARALYTESYNEMLDERDRALRALESLQDDIEEHLPAYAADADALDDDGTRVASETVEHAGDEIRELRARVAALTERAESQLPVRDLTDPDESNHESTRWWARYARRLEEEVVGLRAELDALKGGG